VELGSLKPIFTGGKSQQWKTAILILTQDLEGVKACVSVEGIR
jgi:hypothetical protein